MLNFVQLKFKASVQFDERDKVSESPSGDSEAPFQIQYAKTIVKIYEAENLRKLKSGILSNVKKAFSHHSYELLDPFVQVILAGLKGFTSKKKNTLSPCWNEQIIFTTVFPVPGNQVVLQIINEEICVNNVISTIIIHLDEISNSNSEGFLPTFGPCYINLYDSDTVCLSESSGSYRGKLLIEVATEVLDLEEIVRPNVKTELISSLPEGSFGHEIEFFLFGCIREVTMINKTTGNKGEINVSLSFGNQGFDFNDFVPDASYVTSPMIPLSTNKDYSYLPILEDKPCVWIKSSWIDYRRQMFNANIFLNLLKEIDKQLKVIEHEMSLHSLHVESVLEQALQDLKTIAKECYNIFKIILPVTTMRTCLEKEQSKLHLRQLEHVLLELDVISKLRADFKIEECLNKLQQIKKSIIVPGNLYYSMPDVILGVNAKSSCAGYVRIPARDIIYSAETLERGKYCGQSQIFFAKPFSGNSSLSSTTIAKLNVHLWLGSMKHICHCYSMLPIGHDYSFDDTKLNSPPKFLKYNEKCCFELRCHIYQARCLADLKWENPCLFTKVFFTNRCLSTQVISNTPHPVWDEMLLSNDIVLYGSEIEIRERPLPLIIELYNYGISGKSKLIGRTSVFPLVKLRDESYAAPKFPPKLQWHTIYSELQEVAQILATFELLQLSENESNICANKTSNEIEQGPITYIPYAIRPVVSKYRLEVLFWGIRNLRRFNLKTIVQPRIDICCMGFTIHSTPILNYKNSSNFGTTTNYLDIELPEEVSFWPPLVINLMDCRSFGRITHIASHIVNTSEYILKGFTYNEDQRNSLLIDPRDSEGILDLFVVKSMVLPCLIKRKSNTMEEEGAEEDWWSRYNSSKQMNVTQSFMTSAKVSSDRFESGDSASIELGSHQQHISVVGTIIEVEPVEKHKCSNESLLTVYPCELESVPEFGGFREWLHSFQLTRSSINPISKYKRKTAGVFKGCFRVYEPPLESHILDEDLPFRSSNDSIFQGLPSNEHRKVLVRVYIVKAIDLSPADVSNTADPYIVIKLGSQTFSDKENYVSKQLNPTFGKCFEFTSQLPWDYELTIQIFDWDLVGSDDLIGETTLDLENRFYSRHRPSCGLARYYELHGPNAWRDAVTPSQILTQLCRENKLDGPHFTEDKIRIGKTIYDFHFDTKDEWKLYVDEIETVENMALHLLHQWEKISPAKYQLTPEHIETRTLYHPDKAGEPQGKLEMWLDMFSEDEVPPTLACDISPRKPLSFELRVIIWNTDEVILADDNFFTGEKMSDIYVKGWLEGMDDIQSTDVHYKSLTGEGNFNWRFIFRFEYLPIDRKIVVSKKSNLLSWDDTEFKFPAKIHLEVWDADHFSADECLGNLTLDLNHIPRGSQTAKLCTLAMLEKTCAVPHVSIFKQPRIKGWWPFTSENNGEIELTGKVEAEFHLLTKEEAEESPAGLARREPDPLEPPDRPATSSLSFLNPWKTFRYTIWKNFKWIILKALILFLLSLIFLLFIYAFPGYAVKKILGA